MSGSEEEVFEIGETIDDRDQEAQPLPGAMSPILGTPKGRRSERTVRVAGSLRAGGVGGNGAADVGRAVDDGAGASGGVSADVRTKAELYGEKAVEFYRALEAFNPLKRKVADLEHEIVVADDKVVALKDEIVVAKEKCVALKTELEEAVNKMQTMAPIVHDMQKELRDMTQMAGKD
jgi:hypothetical protein